MDDFFVEDGLFQAEEEVKEEKFEFTFGESGFDKLDMNDIVNKAVSESSNLKPRYVYDDYSGKIVKQDKKIKGRLSLVQ